MAAKYKDGKRTITRYTQDELAKLPVQTDWQRVDAMNDDELTANAASDPDSVPADAQWDSDQAMTLDQILEQRRKHSISLRVKKSTLDFFKDLGPGYQTKMLALLDMFAESGGKLVPASSQATVFRRSQELTTGKATAKAKHTAKPQSRKLTK